MSQDEMKALKERAKLMGIQHSPNIGIHTLKAKIAAVLEGEHPEDNYTAPTKSKGEIRAELMKKVNKLVRIRITNMNPDKRELPGEVYTAGNDYVGVFRKFIPYGAGTENGYHVPMILYNVLKEKTFTQRREYRDPNSHTGIRTETTDVKEFAIEELPPLTYQELKDLAAQQAAANSVQ